MNLKHTLEKESYSCKVIQNKDWMSLCCRSSRDSDLSRLKVPSSTEACILALPLNIVKLSAIRKYRQFIQPCKSQSKRKPNACKIRHIPTSNHSFTKSLTLRYFQSPQSNSIKSLRRLSENVSVIYRSVLLTCLTLSRFSKKPNNSRKELKRPLTARKKKTTHKVTILPLGCLSNWLKKMKTSKKINFSNPPAGCVNGTES